MMLAQVTNDQITIGAMGAALLLLIKGGFEIVSQYNETRERRRMREELIKQTEILRTIHEQQDKTCRWTTK